MRAHRAAVTGCGRGLGRALRALAVLGAFLVLPALAHAQPARFTWEMCDSALPGGGVPPFEFHNANNAAYAPFDTCAQPGGALGISETGQVSNTPSWIEVAVPPTPGGFVEAETISAFASNLQPGNEASHVYADGWPGAGGQDLPRLFQIRTAPAFLGNGGGFNIVMDCSDSPCNPGGTIAANYIAVTEVDPIPPKIGPLEGTLLSGETLRGHQTLAASASDVGGGLSKVWVSVNGAVAGEPSPGACAVAAVKNPSYTGVAALSPTPCPSSLAVPWTLDTASYPFTNGANTVQVCASDFATVGEPNTTCTPVQTVEVNNTCTESAVAGGKVLNADFSGSNDEAVTVPFNHAAEVTGQLADTAGDPISGATICVESATEGEEGEPQLVATASTDSGGQFSYEVPPGPNRRLLIGYRHDSFQVAKTIDYHAQAEPTLHLRPSRVRGGRRIHIVGHLPGPENAGRVVVLQAGSLHGRWLTFRKATTGPRGYFAASYRFGRTKRAITYKMRAVVPMQAGYPYDAGHSKPARVKVRKDAAHRRRHGKRHRRCKGRPAGSRRCKRKPRA